MKVLLNGSELSVDRDCSVSDLIISKEIPQRGVAVAINNKVIPRTNWSEFKLSDNCEIILITASQGG